MTEAPGKPGRFRICQVGLCCDSERVRWDEWHCDHRVPWISGGKTTVENGQVSCVACNQKKGANKYGSPGNGLLE